MDEPPIHYYVQGVPQASAWQSAAAWPPQDKSLTPYYFDRRENGRQGVQQWPLDIDSRPSTTGSFDAYITVTLPGTAGISRTCRRREQRRGSAPASMAESKLTVHVVPLSLYSSAPGYHERARQPV